MKAKPPIKARRAKPTVPADASALFIHKEDVAKRLGVTPRTVGIWAAQAKLPAYRFGRFLRFKWAEVEQALAKTFRVCEPHGPNSKEGV